VGIEITTDVGRMDRDRIYGWLSGEAYWSRGIPRPVFDRSIDKKSLIGPNALAVEVSAAVRRENPTFGLMLDLSHLPLQFETSEQALNVARDHLVHAHIGNCVLNDKGNPLYGDLHPRFGVEGGENDVPEVVEYLSVLRDIGYIGDGKQNVVAFEVKPAGGESSAVVIANAKSARPRRAAAPPLQLPTPDGRWCLAR